jgi:hypothetical protein
VLASSESVRPVHEPDNETEAPWAVLAKRALGRFPSLGPGEAAPAYAALWGEALSSPDASRPAQLARSLQQRHLSVAFDAAEAACDPERRVPLTAWAIGQLARPRRVRASCAPERRPPRVLVKSVHAALCADWLLDRFAPAILVVHRDPVEVVASWRSMAARHDGSSDRLEYAGRPRRLLSADALRHLCARYGPPPEAPAEALTWLAGGLIAVLDQFAARPGVATLDFDAACADPPRLLAQAARQLGLEWGPGCETALAAADRPGEGWTVARETASVPGAWRRRLDPEAVAAIEQGLSRLDAGRSQA